MKTVKALFIGVFSVLIIIPSINGQVSEIWKSDLKSDILWQEVTSLGHLIVCSNHSLAGVNTDDGSTLWAIEGFADIPREAYHEVSGSPLLSITKEDVIFLVDPFSGEIIFNSQKAGLVNMASNFFLYKNNGILVAGENRDSNEPLLIFVDIATGEINWKLEEKFGRIITAYEISNEEILLVTLFNSYKIKSTDGTIVWKSANSAEAEQVQNMGKFGKLMQSAAEEMTKNMEFKLQFYMPEGQDIFYLAAENSEEKTIGQSTTTVYTNNYTAFNLSDGSRIWANPLETSGKLGQIYFHSAGIVVLPDDGNRTKINLFDYKTKEGKWGKKGRGIAIKGGVYTYAETEKGLLLVTSTTNGDFLNFLDPDQGIITFDKPIKIDGRVMGIVNLPKGVFYITTEELNVLDPNTGALLLGKSIPTSPSLTASKDGKIYVFDTKEGLLKVVDEQSATVSNLSSAALKFEGKEKPESIELRDGGIFINSSQNVAMIDYDGKLIFQKYYPAPREPGLKRALLYAQAARAAYIGVNAYYASAALQTAAPEVEKDDAVAGAIVQGMGEVYGELGDVASDFAKKSFQQANKRFKATSEGRDFMIILMTEDKGIYLVKVNKNTGKIEGKIDLGKERNPEYAVDDVTGQIYQRTGDTEIISYKL